MNPNQPINTPYRLSHGTLECRDFALSRPFYEEFLGLECVRHAKPAMLLRKGGYWGIVCIEMGEKARPLGVMNHWGLDMESREQVDRAHAAALEYADHYGIQKIHTPGDTHGTYGFYLQDRDGNWWEFHHVEDDRYEQIVARGDIDVAAS